MRSTAKILSRHARSVGLWTVGLVLGVAVSGCDLVPSDGPSANNLLAHASENRKPDPAAEMRFALVDVNARVAREVDRY